MKKKFLAWLLCVAMVVVMLPVTAWADSADPVMTLTTSRAIGSNIMLSLQAKNAEDLAGVWVDLNGNAVKDAGEDNVGLYKSYTIGSQTITIYGKVTLLDCVLADTATALDVSKNPYLESLACRSGSLTALDVSQNTALTKLDVYHNSLTALDVSQNTALTILNVSDNQITALDVSSNTALKTLNCSNNSVAALNLSANPQLTNLQCANCGLTGLDVSTQTALTELNCRNNAIISLDLSANLALINLFCTNNALTALTLPQSTALQRVECEKNKLTALDISQNAALMQVKLYCNQIKGAAMATIVSALPATTKNYKLYVIDTAASPADGNVALESDVAIATGRGWKVMDYNNGYEQAYAGDTDPSATTFVLSNEEGGLIDQLIAEGHGGDTMYEVMQLLQPMSGGAIPASFMSALAATPADSEVKTVTLNNFSGLNNPVGVNTDGTVMLTSIYSSSYHDHEGYTTSQGDQVGIGIAQFTVADSAAYYIDTGMSMGDGNYHAFAIVWSGEATTFTVAGTATDDVAILQIDNKTPSARDKTWEINVTSGTVKAGLTADDVTLTGLPAGLGYTAAKGTGNSIVLTLTGVATTALTADATVTATIKGSAVTEAGAQDSAGISLNLWYIGPGTTVMLSNELGADNEGGLIDALIAAGHEDYNLYEVLELLQPHFSSVITERFMKTLASNPADSEIFDAALSNFSSEYNNPIGINTDGTLIVAIILGRDYNGDTGYTTTTSSLSGVGSVQLTAADSDDFIDAGSLVYGDTAHYYKAFAIAWMSTGGGGGGGGGGSATQTYSADVNEGGVKTDTLPVTVSSSSGMASLNAAKAERLLRAGNASVSMPDISGVSAYRLELPASALTANQKGAALTLTTGFGSVTFPANMLSSLTGADGKTAGITIARGDVSGLTDVEKTAVGNRPIVQLTLTLDGVQTDWNNPAAPVTVTIPYTPTAEEAKNPESLIIWYLGGSGKLVCVPNGHYDAATGTVAFKTTHFSQYAVGYNPVSFKDVADGVWYKRAVSFIGARGVTTDTGNGNYSPEAKLTRGDIIVMIMRTYSIAPDANPTDNFADAGNTYYTNYLAAAKRLGISNGVGNNLYAPGKEITRQEMFTLLYNALNILGQLPEGNSGKTLADFSDADSIASWAKDAMTLLVETGIVSGNGGKLSPTDTTIRAEMAQVLCQGAVL